MLVCLTVRYEIRSAFTLINYEEESCATLIELIQKSAINSFYLGHEAGRKLVVYWLTMNPTMVDRVHESIKCQLTVAKSHMTSAYAEIYYQVRARVGF